MRWALLALLCGTMTAQTLTVKATPIRLVTTRKALGNRVAGLWTIDVCAHGNASVAISRGRLLMPSTLPFLPNDLAEDVINRDAAGSFESTLSASGGTLLAIGGSITAGIGYAAKSPTAVAVGAGVSVVQLLIGLATKRAPAPTAYASKLLPATVAVTANGCEEWFVYTGLVRESALIPAVWTVEP